jgi:hypothetical protein
MQPELGTVTAADLRRVLGAIDDDKTMVILKLAPTPADLEEAAVWAAGDGDVLAKGGRPLTPVARQIVDILATDADEEP